MLGNVGKRSEFVYTCRRVHNLGVLLKVRCKSSSEVIGLRVVKKVDVSDDQKWAVFVLPKGRCK